MAVTPQSAAGVVFSAALSAVVDKPDGTSDGDLLVLVCLSATQAEPTWTPPAGFTAVGSATGLSTLFWKLASGEPASYTVTVTGSTIVNRTASMIRITGQASGTPISAASVIDTVGGTATIVLPSVTATTGCGLIQMGVINQSGTSWTPPGGTTEAFEYTLSDTSLWVGAVGYDYPSAGATGTRTWTKSTSAPQAGGVMFVVTAATVTVTPGNVKITYRANNTFTCPTGVTSATVQCEGGGAGSGDGSALFGGGGGGGGAYASSAVALTPGNTYSVVVGAAAAATVDGNLSSFGTGPLVRGAGGKKGTNGTAIAGGTGGAGGAVADSIGTTKTAGTAGSNGSAASGGAGGAGAAPLGGAGGAPSSNPGTAPGGGASGGGIASGAGDSGAQGVVVVTFDYVTENLSANDSFQLVVDWDRRFNETVAATDAIAKLVLKPLSESVVATDFMSKRVIKPYAEAVTAADVIAKIISQLRTETIVTADTIAKLDQLLKSENVTATDAITKLIRKTHPESVVTSDTIAKYLRKPVADGVTASEFALIVLVYLRNVDDTATATDQISKLTRLGKADAAVVTDSIAKWVRMTFANDGVTVSDSFSKISTFDRRPADTATALDSLSKYTRLLFADSISGSVGPAPSTGRRIFVISD